MEISNIDFSSILEMVNTFYSNAWYTLIGVLGVATVILPIVLKKLLDYRTKIEIDKVEENLRKQFHNLSSENEKLIEKKIMDITKKLEETTAKKFEDIIMEINDARGVSWHTLGNIYDDRKDYKSSLEFYFSAYDSYFIAKDEMNMQVIMDSIIETYQEIKDSSFLKEIETKHLDLIEKLSKINENNRYSNSIDKMQKALTNLKKRLMKI